MPYMTREEIVKRYGFDPGVDENQSVFVKNPEGEEANTPPLELRLPKEEAPAPREWTEPSHYQERNAETPTANPAKMLASGAIRGWVSDPLLLAGVAMAGLSAASGKITGAEGSFVEQFKKGLYKPGGLEDVQNHLREKQSELYKEHPDWDSDQIHHEMLKYQASKDFFQYHTTKMATAYGLGMDMAARTNGMLGIAKTPEQETWMDEAAQILGQVITPSFGVFNKGVSVAAKTLGATAPKSVELLAKGADILALPGTATSHYTPGVLAGSLGAGVAINEGVRALSGEPTAIGGGAFTPRDRFIGGPTTDPAAQGPGPRPSDYILPGAGAVAGAAVLGRTLRGRPRINLNPISAGPQIPEQAAAERARIGMEPFRDDPNLAQQPVSVEGLSRAINEWEPVERLARDVVRRAEERAQQAGVAPHVTQDALEVDVQAAHGMDISRHSRDSAISLAREEGRFPDKSRAETTIRMLEQRAQTASPESLNTFKETVGAVKEADLRLRGTIDLMGEYQTKPNDPVILRSLAGRLADDPNSRPHLTGWSDRDIGNRVTKAMADPEAYEMLQMYADINRSINRYRYNAGLTTQEQYLAQQARPFHTPLYEFSGENYDPGRQAARWVDPANPGIRPNNIPDPFSGINLNMAMAIDEGKINTGKRRVIDQLMAADTQGEFLRHLGPAAQFDKRPAGSVAVYKSGREELYQFSRASVADALQAQPLTLGPYASVANNFRGWFHYMTTGPIMGGIPTAIRSSLLYDVSAGYTTARQGRSFGYASKWGRALNAKFGDNRLVNQFIDTARAFDVTAPIQTVAAVPQMIMWRTVDAVGRSMMDAAINKSGLFAAIAKTPAGRQWLQDAGAGMAQAVERSLYGIMKHGNVLQPHAMMHDSFVVKNRYEQFIAENMNARRDFTLKRGFQAVTTPWMALIDNIHNSAKYAFYGSNYVVLEARYGRGNIPEHELTRLAEETRRMSGDIQAHGGSAHYNAAMATTPYGNIALQANRHLLHAAFAQGSKQSFDVALRLSVLGGTAYAGMTYVRALGDEAVDWYWNGLNEWERWGTTQIPSFESFLHMAKTGQWMPFNRERPLDSFMAIGSQMPRMAAELVPFYQIGLAAAEHVGLIDRGKNTARGSAMKDWLGTVAGSVGIGSSQLISVPMAIAGYKADFLNPLRGRGIATEIKGPKGEDGRTPGGIPVVAAEMAKALYGTGIDALIQSTDAGLQGIERGNSFMEALGRAGLEARTKLVDERYPSVPGLWKASEKVYGSNAEGTRIKNMEQTERDIEKTWQTEFGKGLINLPEAGRIRDPDVRMTVAYAHGFFGKGGWKKLSEQRTMLEQAKSNLDAQKDRYTPEQINERKRQYDIQIRGVQSKMIPVIELYEKAMGEGRMGEAFKRHGLEPRLESVPALVGAYKRKAPR